MQSKSGKIAVCCLVIWCIVLFSLPLFSGLDISSFESQENPFKLSGEKYNVLIITIDTLRPDRLGCYGSKFLRTPAIDSIAVRGVVFNRAFAHTPLTLPSHASILLGLTPLEHGVHDNGFFRVPDKLPTLATLLKKHGYSCGAFIGAFPLDSRFGLNRDFDVYDQGYDTGSGLDFKFAERKAEQVISGASRWLEIQKGPWFLWVHCFDPHQPYEPPEPFLSQYREDLYSGEVAYTDAVLGKLFNYLEHSGHLARTVIVITGDHGQSLGEHGELTHGYFAYNSTLWVPLIIYSPSVKPRQVSVNVAHMDIFPTVCELLGLPLPGNLAGKSLVPLMKGKSLPPRRIYFESLYAYYRRGWAPLRGFIEGNKKFIDSPVPELYDLKEDFQEARNLATAAITREKEILDRMVAEAVARPGMTLNPALEAGARERLASLGYIGGYTPPEKKIFGPEDDLKTLLPFNQKFEKAQELFYVGKTAESIKLLREIISGRPDFDNPYLFLTTIYEKTGRLEEARKLLEDGVRLNPRNFKLWMELGIVQVQLNRYEEAISSLNRALELIDWDPDLWNYLGVAYGNKGDLYRAKEIYEKGLTLAPDYAVLLTNLGLTELSLALQTRNGHLLEEARGYLKKAIDKDPWHVEAYNGLGAVLMVQGDINGALEMWKKVVELVPEHRFGLFNLGKTFLELGERDKAREFLERYKKIYYNRLSAKEKEEIDYLLRRCGVY